MEINPNEVIANLLNKVAGLTLEVAKLEVAVQSLQTNVPETGDNGND